LHHAQVFRDFVGTKIEVCCLSDILMLKRDGGAMLFFILRMSLLPIRCYFVSSNRVYF